MKRGSGTRARARRHARRARRAVEGRRCRRTYIFASLVCCGLGRELGKGEVRARRELFTHRAKRSETRDRPISARFLTYRAPKTSVSHVSRKRNFHFFAKRRRLFYLDNHHRIVTLSAALALRRVRHRPRCPARFTPRRRRARRSRPPPGPPRLPRVTPRASRCPLARASTRRGA